MSRTYLDYMMDSRIGEIAYLFNLDPAEVEAMGEFFGLRDDVEEVNTQPETSMREMRRTYDEIKKSRLRAVVGQGSGAEQEGSEADERAVYVKCRKHVHNPTDQLSKQNAVDRLGRKLDTYVARAFRETRILKPAES